MLRILERWGHDVPAGMQTDFHCAVQAAADESMVFSGVDRPDKATRAAGHARMGQFMSTDPRFEDRPMSFDGKRLIFGAFTPMVEL